MSNALIEGENARVTLKTMTDPFTFDKSETFCGTTDTTAVDGLTDRAFTGESECRSEFWWVIETAPKKMRETKAHRIMLRFRSETFRLPPFYNER